MEVSKKAQGSIVKSLTFNAKIICKDSKDQEVYDQCVEWRQLRYEADTGEKAFIAASQSDLKLDEDEMAAGMSALRSQSVVPSAAAGQINMAEGGKNGDVVAKLKAVATSSPKEERKAGLLAAINPL